MTGYVTTLIVAQPVRPDPNYRIGFTDSFYPPCNSGAGRKKATRYNRVGCGFRPNPTRPDPCSPLVVRAFYCHTIVFGSKRSRCAVHPIARFHCCQILHCQTFPPDQRETNINFSTLLSPQAMKERKIQATCGV